MSTNIPSEGAECLPSTHVRAIDTHAIKVHCLVTENAFFSALDSLVEYRRVNEGITKVCLAERLGKDKGTVTRLTSRPSNMKVSTIASLASALDAHVALVFIAKENTSIVFTSTGMRMCGLMQISVSNARPITSSTPYSAKVFNPSIGPINV